MTQVDGRGFVTASSTDVVDKDHMHLWQRRAAVPSKWVCVASSDAGRQTSNTQKQSKAGKQSMLLSA